MKNGCTVAFLSKFIAFSVSGKTVLGPLVFLIHLRIVFLKIFLIYSLLALSAKSVANLIFNFLIVSVFFNVLTLSYHFLKAFLRRGKLYLGALITNFLRRSSNLLISEISLKALSKSS